MMKIDIGDLKMARESLCRIQSAIQHPDSRFVNDSDATRIQRMIDQIDELRPLGPDGKHGDRHTPYCGCEDVELPEPIKDIEKLAQHFSEWTSDDAPLSMNTYRQAAKYWIKKNGL